MTKPNEPRLFTPVKTRLDALKKLSNPVSGEGMCAWCGKHVVPFTARTSAGLSWCSDRCLANWQKNNQHLKP